MAEEDKIGTTQAKSVYSGFITKKQVALLTHLSIRTVDNLISQKKIPFIKVTKRAIRFRWSAVEAALLRLERQAIC